MERSHIFTDPNRSARERAADLVAQLSVDEKCELFTSSQKAIPRLGIPETKFGVEVARGLVQRNQARETTILPQPWGMAASFDDALMEQAGAVVGDEIRICNQMEDSPASLALFGPTVDLLRDPRWGRNEEAYSEDPCLNGRMTAAYTRGLTGDHPYYLKSAPLLKHFYANNYEAERLTTNASIPTRLKRDYYLKAFEAAIVHGRAPGLMTAYNSINGVEAILNPEVREIAKKEWGMVMAVSDGGDFGQTVTAHRTYDNHAESIAATLGNGADIMLDSSGMVNPAVREALDRGLINESTLNTVLEDIFTLRFMLGEFDPELNPYAKVDPSLLASKAHKEIAVKLAEKSMILLENKDMLPLSKDGTGTIAVVGPLSNENYTCWYCGYAASQTTVVEGLRSYLSKSRVRFDEGLDHIRIKSRKTGLYVRILDTGELKADADPAQADIFERNDWNYGSWTLRSLTGGTYLTEGFSGSDTEAASPSLLRFDIPITCTAKEAFGWFVKEWLKVSIIDDVLYMNTWQDRNIVVTADQYLRAGIDSNDTPERQFEVEVISSGASRIAALASSVDHVILCAGNHPLINAREETDRPDIRLPGSQSQLLNAAVAQNPSTLLYLITGYPYSINEEKEKAKAVLCSTHLGPSLGRVAAKTIFGESNPAGRTPTTWYQSIRDLPAIDDYNIQKNKVTYLYFEGNPLYPFGYGLSYSRFTYHDVSVNSRHFKEDGQVDVSFSIRNESDRDGDEVAQLYVRMPESIFKRPRIVLKDFKRIHIPAHESKQLSLRFKIQDLGMWDVHSNRYVVEKGDYILQVGPSSASIASEIPVYVDGQAINGLNAQQTIHAIDAEDYHRVEFKTDRKDESSYVEVDDFRSYIVYPGLELGSANTFEAVVSSPAGEFDLILVDHDTEEIIAQVSSEGTASFTRFKTVNRIIPKRNSLLNLRLNFTKTCSLKTFRFYEAT